MPPPLCPSSTFVRLGGLRRTGPFRERGLACDRGFWGLLLFSRIYFYKTIRYLFRLYFLPSVQVYEITDLKPGRAIQLDGEPFIVLSSVFGRKSQSKANMQCKLRNLKTGAVVARNFQGSEKIEPADVGYRKVQYLYNDGTDYTFMDLDSYDQFTFSADMLGDSALYLVDGNEVDALMFEGNPIGIQVKATVELKVIETIPGVKGDTATGGNKPAKLESGLTVNVPLFVNEGDTIKVNTETGLYMTRVS